MNPPLYRIVLFIIGYFFFCSHSQVFGLDIQPDASTIKSITVISPQGEPYDELKNNLPIKIGDKFSSQAIKESIEYLYSTETFSNILVSLDKNLNGISLTFTVIEKLKVENIEWAGNKYFSNQKLREVSELDKDRELLNGWEDEIKKKLTDFYRSEGYMDVKIKVFSRKVEKGNRLYVDVVIDEGEQMTVDNIYFTGDTGLDQNKLLETLRIHSGFYYSSDRVKKSIENLYPLYFRARYLRVKIKDFIPHLKPFNKVDIEIPVEAGPRIFTSILFKGNHHYLSLTLRSYILIEAEKSIDESTLEESVKRLVNFYQNEGYPFSEVKVERREEENGKVIHVTFYITEGSRALLTDLIFKGNSSISDKILRETISHRQTGYWVPSYLRLPLIPSDLENLSGIYRANGFLSPVIKQNIHYAEDKRTASLEFEITEGVRTFIRSITLEGVSPSFLDDLRRNLHTREKSPYNDATFVEDKLFINTFYHKRGYADMKMDADVRFSETKDQADIKYTINEGNIIRIGKIEIEGNERTQPRVLKRELLIHPGDLYQEDLILKSQRRLSQLGVFQSVNIRPKNPEDKGTMRNLGVYVKERNGGAVEFGAGYADVERFGGFAEISHRNIAGTGRRASFRTEISEIGKKEVFNYTEPRVFDLPLDAKGSVFYETLIKPPVNYTLTTLGGSVGVEKTFREYYKASLLYQIDLDRFSDVPPNQQLIPEDKDHANIVSLNPSLISDTRDDFLNPAKGALNAVWFRWAAKFMGSEVQEVKLTLQSSWFFPLGAHMVMGISGRGGVANNFGETADVPISERFLLGGRSTIRGYAENTIGVPGQAPSPGLPPTGGNSFVLFNWELRYNLPKSLGLVLFFDSGNVWRYYNTLWSAPLKSSIGSGFRYNTPVGPIRFDVGFKLNREEGESASEFHFTLGQAF